MNAVVTWALGDIVKTLPNAVRGKIVLERVTATSAY
jgi:hypothetical protein